jgi:hypothetical protein
VDSAQAGLSQKNTSGNLTLKVYPNPSDGKFTIQYTLSKDENVIITITDLLGRSILILTKGNLNAGEYNETFVTKDLKISNGMYICKLQAGDITKTIAISVQH